MKYPIRRDWMLNRFVAGLNVALQAEDVDHAMAAFANQWIVVAWCMLIGKETV